MDRSILGHDPELKLNTGISKSLKAQNQMAWNQKVNVIAKNAEEIVLNEMVYS